MHWRTAYLRTEVQKVNTAILNLVFEIKVKVNQSRYRPGQTQKIPGI